MVPVHVILRTTQCYNITNGTCTCYIKSIGIQSIVFDLYYLLGQEKNRQSHTTKY